MPTMRFGIDVWRADAAVGIGAETRVLPSYTFAAVYFSGKITTTGSPCLSKVIRIVVVS
jgi:hypothetical protein